MVVNGTDLGPPIPVYSVWIKDAQRIPKIMPGYRATKRLCIAEHADGTWGPINAHGLCGFHFPLAKQAYQCAVELEQSGIKWDLLSGNWPAGTTDEAKQNMTRIRNLYAPLSAYPTERASARKGVAL